MPDIFDQEGITFQTAPMASTHPTATPDPIPAPKIQLPSTSVAPVSMSELQAPTERGAIPPPPNPQQIAAQAGDEGLATPGAAPPQASVNEDIFDKENIGEQSAPVAANSFARGVVIPNGLDSNDADAEKAQVTQYAAQQQAQATTLAASRFTPEQISSFANNPMSITEAVQNAQDWPDVPELLRKHQGGETLDANQQRRLNEYVDTTLSSHLRGMSWNGNTAVTGQQLPAPAISYVRGAGSGQIAVSELPPVQPNLNGNKIVPPPYYPKAGEKPLNDFMAVTDKGQQIMSGAKENPVSTALKAAAYPQPAAADAPAHVNGNMISSIDQLPVSLRSALFDAYKNKNPKASMAQMMTPQGWNKAIDDIGEDGVSQVVHWWSAMSYEEHQAAQAQGGVIPFSVDAEGRTRFDPRAGLMGGVTAPGDALEGRLEPGTPEFDEAALNTAMLMVRPSKAFTVAEKGAKAGISTDLKGETASQSAPEGAGEPAPDQATQQPQNVETPSVDKIMGILTPNKDQMLVDNGTVSIEGAKSAATLTAENILRQKGFSDRVAAETVDSMTANEKDQFVQHNLKAPTGKFPVAASGIPIEESPSAFSDRISERLGADVALQKNGKDLILSAIKVGEDERSQGIGTKAMQEIIQYADEQGKRIVLTPSTDFGATSVGRLKEFYKRFGFVENTGKNKDFSTRETMYRDPSSDAILAAGTPNDVATAIGDSQIKAANAKEPPQINDAESGYNALTQRLSYLYRRVVNTLDPIENAETLAKKRGEKIEPGQSPKLLSNLYGNVSAMTNHYLSQETFTWGKDGNTRVTGKSLKGIMDDLDGIAMRTEPVRSARFKDFNDYLLAQRYKELETIGEGKVKDKQIEWSNKRLAELSDKYGDTLHLVENLSQEVYAMQRRTMDVLVDSGVVSRETADTLATKYPRYVPLDRVFDQADHEAYVKARDTLMQAEAKPEAVAPAEKKAATKAMKKLVEKYGENIEENLGTPIKSDGSRGKPTGKFSGAGPQGIIQKLKGSQRDAREPLVNIFERTHKAIDRAYRNRVAQSIDNLKDILPDYIQPEKPRIVNKGKAEVRITHDPILDQKLDRAIEYFKHKFERTKSIKIKGFRNVLGSYDPMEKLIRGKLGANEAVKTHEVGHMLDYELGLGEKLLADKKVKAELQRLAEERIGGEVKTAHGAEGIELITERRKVGGKYKAYIRNDREIIANLFDAYVNAPDLLDKLAPTAKAAFEEALASNKDLAFLKDIKPSLAREERTIEKEVWGEAEDLPPNTIEVYKNGERSLLKLAQPMYEAMTQLGPARMTFIEKLLNGTFGLSKRVLQRGATSTVAFIERNVFRDQMDAMIQGGVRYNAPWDFSKGLFAAFGHTDLYKNWVRSGGAMHFMALGDEGMARSYKELLNGEGRLNQLLMVAPKISEKFEQTTRIGLFNAAKRRGLSDLEASMASLEGTLNFGRSGDVTRTINKYVPFFNAGVQGADKLIRTAAKNPRATLMWGIGTVTIPTMLLSGYYLYAADEKTRQEYIEIPQWQKDMYWTVKVGDEWRSIPKPFSWGYIFGSIPERIMLHSYTGNDPGGKNLWLSTAQGLMNTLSPVNDWSATMPPMMKVVAEWQANYNFFMGRNIYPTWMEDLPPEQRSGAYTSQVAQVIGEHSGQSPALIENSIIDQTGGLGRYGLKAGDMMLNQVKKWSGEPVAEKPATDADNILLQGFTMRDPMGTNSTSVQNFFNNYKEAKQAHLGEKNVPEDQLEAYRENRQQQLSSYATLNRAHKQISNLQKEVMRIVKDTDTKGDEKRTQIRELNSQMTDIAREANSEYNAAAPAAAQTGE